MPSDIGHGKVYNVEEVFTIYPDPNALPGQGNNPIAAYNVEDCPSYIHETDKQMYMDEDSSEQEAEEGRLETRLFKAVREQNLTAIATFIKAGDDINVIVQNENADMCFSALMVAAASGYVDIVQALLHAGALVDLQNTNGITALRMSIDTDHCKVLEILLFAKADPNRKDNRGRSTFMMAARQNLPGAVMLMITYGAAVNDYDNEVATAFLHAAIEGFVRVMKILLANKAWIDYPDNAGSTPLMLASFSGHISAVEFLVENKADVHVCDNAHRNALDYASQHEEIYTFLQKLSDPLFHSEDGIGKLGLGLRLGLRLG